MDNFYNNLKLRFKQKDILIQLIIINVAIFLILSVLRVIAILFKLDNLQVIEYIAVSSDINLLASRPWTVFTYMLVHKGFLHILFNMLMLYWFGQVFLSYFSPKNLGSLYVLGGLAGAALYILAFNTIPYYREMGHPIMIGASGAVMAIIFAAAFYNPNRELMLLLLGRIKIVYIAIFIFILDFISLGDPSNPGGHVAHIGGALIGYIFAKQYLNGRDITRWITHIIDSIANISKPKARAKLKVKHRKSETDYEYNQRRRNETENIDRILDKIKASGYSSLNAEEKKQLFDASKK